MSRERAIHRWVRYALLFTLGAASAPAAAQQADGAPPAPRAQAPQGQPPTKAKAPSDTVAVPDSVVAFARTHLALQALRDRMQAELAEPRNKKDESQREIRERMRGERARILKEYAMTEERVARLTRWVSVDEEGRRWFEAALAREAK